MALKELRFGQNGIEEYDKVQTAIDRLQSHEPEEGYYLAFSGGKDSITIYRLAEMAGVSFDAHYNLTTVDPPELVNFIKDEYPDVNIDYPEMTMWELIPHKKMPPTRIVRYCCEVLKERGGMGRFVVTGIRWQESASRKKRRMVESCNKHKNKLYIHPIIDWSEKEVWEFIKQENIKYCGLYDEGHTRLGCIGCPMQGGDGMKRDFKKWPKYRNAYVRAFERMIKARKEAGLETDWENGEEVLKWWVGDQPKEIKGAEGQKKFACFDN